jgi:hypothetical protein
MRIAEYKKHPPFTDLADHIQPDCQRIFDYLGPRGVLEHPGLFNRATGNGNSPLLPTG